MKCSVEHTLGNVSLENLMLERVAKVTWPTCSSDQILQYHLGSLLEMQISEIMS